MLGGPGWRLGEITRMRKLFRQVSGNLGKVTELGDRNGFENHLVAMLFNENLGAIETERLRQTDRLTTTVLKDFRSAHSYILYL